MRVNRLLKVIFLLSSLLLSASVGYSKSLQSLSINSTANAVTEQKVNYTLDKKKKLFCGVTAIRIYI